MNFSRFTVLVAVLVAFIAGVWVGHYLAEPATPPPEPASAAGAAILSAKASHPELEKPRAHVKEGDLAESAGNSAVQRFWSVMTIAEERERHAAWLEMLAQLTPAETLQVRDLFRKMEAQGRQFPFEWSAFWPRWGEVDAQGALAYLKNNEWPSWRPTAAEMILRGWAKKDPASARSWLEANPASPWYDGALRGYLDGLARSNLDRATNEISTLAKGRPLTRLMEVLTEQSLRQRQLGGMVAWWEALPDDTTKGSSRQEAIGHVYWRLKTADPARAGEWLSSLASTPYRSNHHISELAEEIGKRNPAAAVEWVSSLPPSPSDGHYTAIGRSVTALARTDAAALEQWLQKLPDSPLRDQAAAAYVTHLAASEQRDLARKWMSTVADPTKIDPRTLERLTRAETEEGQKNPSSGR